MDKVLSNKIKIISFFCTVLVVFRHGLNLQAFGLSNNEASYISIIEHGVSKITEVAVPYFFIVSGYFFSRHTYYNNSEYVTMMKKKARTLFIPFIFWNIVGLFPLLLTHQFVFEDNPLLYILQLLNSDWNGVLWYVRDIMTIMLLAPLYTWIFMVNNRWLYTILFILLFINWWPVECRWLSSEGMLFFFIGGILQKNSKILNKEIHVITLSGLWIIWMLSCFCFPFYWPIHRYNTLLGLVVIWQLFRYIPQQLSIWMLNASAYSFFIYVIHIFIIKSMKVGVANFFLGNEIVALLSYFILPLLTISIILYLGKKINKYFPKEFNIITGGRS